MAESMKQATDNETKAKRPMRRGAKTRSAAGRRPASKQANGRRGRSAASAANGNGGIANSLLTRGRSAFDGASSWAGEVPRAMRNMHMPDRRSLQSMADERPLLLGAVGLGIGVLIGALLPSMHSGNGRSRRQ